MGKSKVPLRPRGWKLPLLTAAPAVDKCPLGAVGISTLPKLDQQSGTVSTVFTSPLCTNQLDQTTSNPHFSAHQSPRIRPPPSLTFGSTRIRPPPPLTIGSSKNPSAFFSSGASISNADDSTVRTTTATFTTPFSFKSLTTTTPTTTPVLTSSTTTSAFLATQYSFGDGLFSQIEEMFKKWFVGLNEQEKICLTQVNELDICRSRLLSNNEKMVALNDSIGKLQREGVRFQSQLDYIRAQQHDQERMRTVERLKQEVDIKPLDAERKRTYQLIGDICTQMVHFTEAMKKITDELNAINIQSETTANSYTQVAQVVNDQTRQWIESNCASLQCKLSLLLPN